MSELSLFWRSIHLYSIALLALPLIASNSFAQTTKSDSAAPPRLPSVPDAELPPPMAGGGGIMLLLALLALLLVLAGTILRQPEHRVRKDRPDDAAHSAWNLARLNDKFEARISLRSLFLRVFAHDRRRIAQRLEDAKGAKGAKKST